MSAVTLSCICSAWQVRQEYTTWLCTWVLNSGNFSAREQEVQTTYCITEEYWAKKNWDYSSNQTVYWKCYFIRFHKTSIKASQTDASGLLLQHIFIWVSFKTGHCSAWIKSVFPHGHYILHYPFPPQNPYPKESVWFSSLDAGESWPKGPHILLSSKTNQQLYIGCHLWRVSQ